MAPTPYEVLRVPRDCTNDAIRHAYRRLAKEYHPDSNPGNPAAQLRFLEISAAYQAIGAEQKRKLWDLMNPVEVVAAAPSPAYSPPPAWTEPCRSATDDALLSLKKKANLFPDSGRSGRSKREIRPDALRPKDLIRSIARQGLQILGRGLHNQTFHVVLICVALAGGIVMVLPAPQPVVPSAELTEAAIRMLSKQGHRFDAIVTEINTADTGRVSYKYNDFQKEPFTGHCRPCLYPPVQTLKVGDTIKIIHLTGHDFSAPLFAFADLTRVDRELADRVNALAAQSPNANAAPAP